MIDIHSHILYGIDDGADNPRVSRRILRDSYDQGVDAMVATPHFRKNMFETDIRQAVGRYKRVRHMARDISEDFKIYLGAEVYFTSGVLNMLDRGLIPTMAGSDYVLVEFDYSIDYRTMKSNLSDIRQLGLRPILAHVERYFNVVTDLANIENIIYLGGYIQVNATSVMKKQLFNDRHKIFKTRVRRLLDYDLVHFVASDVHNMTTRPSYMGEAYDWLEATYGGDYAEELFVLNQEKILNNIIL
nr:CpsB/CapC family capsule biosynthesis tyrosine phosphatase [uncultured Peptostreptococcus sp.]